MIKRLSDLGITSDVAYIAVAASILLSIFMWGARRSDDRSQAERFGIFIGLWAPTLAVLGRALEETERAENRHS